MAREYDDACKQPVDGTNRSRRRTTGKPTPHAESEKTHAVTDESFSRFRTESIEPIKEMEFGWTCFQHGHFEMAQSHFLRVLRAFPGIFEEAQIGLMESHKAGWWPYRMVRPILFRVKRKSEGNWVFKRGLPTWVVFAVFGCCGAVVRKAPQFTQILWPSLLILLIAFAVVKLADYGATVRLWQSECRRYALLDGAMIGLGFGCLAVLVAFVFLVLYPLLNHFAAIVGAIFFFLLVSPAERTFTVPTGAPRIFMVTYFTLLTAAGVVTTSLAFIRLEGVTWSEPTGLLIGILFLVTFVGALAGGALADLVSRFGSARADAVDAGNGERDPRLMSLSDTKLRRLYPELYGVRGLIHNLMCTEEDLSTKAARQLIRELLQNGDPHAAIVLSLQPLLVAAYSEDMDCVMPLEFDSALVDEYKLERGSRLLAVINYMTDPQLPVDLVPGPGATGRFKNFRPLIAEFLCDDADTIERWRNGISDEEWQKAEVYGEALLRRPALRPRDGRPLEALEPSLD